MLPYILALLMMPALLQSNAAKSDAENILARAQTLYYNASFAESIKLLTALDLDLRSKPERREQQISVKLQLALNYIGLNQSTEAATRFTELYALDPNYTLDPQRFAPKVVLLFEDAKAEQIAGMCQKICSEANRLLEIDDSDGLLKLMQTWNTRCSCLEGILLDAASHLYQEGVDAYKRDDFTGALKSFRLAVQFHSEEESAAYIELIQNRIKLAADRSLLQWRVDLDGGFFSLAAAAYLQVQSSNIDNLSAPVLEQMRTVYRQKLAVLKESWNRACTAGDAFMMERVRLQSLELVPVASMSQDLLSDIKWDKNDCR